jgi:hypothetical protein
MTPAEYKRVLHAAHGLRALARQIAEGGGLDAAIEAVGRADSAGAVLDPTLYRERREAMAQDEATLRAVRVLARLGAAGADLVGEGRAAETKPVGVEAPADGSRPGNAGGSQSGETRVPSPTKLRSIPDLAS